MGVCSRWDPSGIATGSGRIRHAAQMPAVTSGWLEIATSTCHEPTVLFDDVGSWRAAVGSRGWLSRQRSWSRGCLGGPSNFRMSGNQPKGGGLLERPMPRAPVPSRAQPTNVRPERRGQSRLRRGRDHVPHDQSDLVHDHDNGPRCGTPWSELHSPRGTARRKSGLRTGNEVLGAAKDLASLSIREGCILEDGLVVNAYPPSLDVGLGITYESGFRRTKPKEIAAGEMLDQHGRKRETQAAAEDFGAGWGYSWSPEPPCGVGMSWRPAVESKVQATAASHGEEPGTALNHHVHNIAADHHND